MNRMVPSLKIIKLVLWVGVMTIVFGTIYASGQHILRAGANDAQVELAEETARQLNLGASPESVLPNGPAVELRDSLRQYVIIYSDGDKQLAGNVKLDNQSVDIPEGVLEHARNTNDHRITWQPADGVRSDIVVKRFSNAASSGFVVAGKSLREVEKQEDQLLLLSGIGWILTVIPLSVYVWLANEPPAKKSAGSATSRSRRGDR